jgi:hypothetical protein
MRANFTILPPIVQVAIPPQTRFEATGSTSRAASSIAFPPHPGLGFLVFNIDLLNSLSMLASELGRTTSPQSWRLTRTES